MGPQVADEYLSSSAQPTRNVQSVGLVLTPSGGASPVMHMRKYHIEVAIPTLHILPMSGSVDCRGRVRPGTLQVALHRAIVANVIGAVMPIL